MKKLHLLILPLLIVSVAYAQNAEELAKGFIGRPLPPNPSERLALAETGERLLQEIGPNNRFFPAVTFRSGSLFISAGAADKAEQLYRDGLQAGSISPSQKAAMWLMLAQSQERQGKNAKALESFRNAKSRANLLRPGERKLVNSWISYLELRSGNEEQVKQRMARVFSQIDSGGFTESLPGDMQFIYENAPDLGPALSQKAFRRLASGGASTDFAIANAAFSHDPEYVEGITMVGLENHQQAIHSRLKAVANDPESILTKLYFAQALGTLQSRQKALEFTALVVSKFDVPKMSPDTKSIAGSLVRELEGLASPSDKRAQQIIADALKKLNEESIVVKNETKPTSSPSVLPLIGILGGILILIGIPFAIKRFKRSK